jgi:hypothetical protein
MGQPVRRLREHRHLAWAGAALVTMALVLTACGSSSPSATSQSTQTTTPLSTTSTTAPSSSAPTTPYSPAPPTPATAARRMFAFYYLWWDSAHWHARLGPNYPYTDTPLPLPANLSGDGCTVTNNYPGNQLTDVASPLWSQSDYSQILSDVTLAAHTGLAGFAVSWAGTGLAGQNANSSTFNQRLAMVVKAVHQINAEGIPFSLWIAYIGSAHIRTLTALDNDMAYLHQTYGTDPAFDRSNSKEGLPTLILEGSLKYPQSLLSSFSAQWRSSFYLVGDENWTTWTSDKAADFDADSYYWSSQNPTTFKGSFADVERLAAEVRSSTNPDGTTKRFFAPLTPGYNKVLGGGNSCVPRLGGQTMQDIYRGNSGSNPDGWTVISWNEIDEGTYIVPLERYGSQSVDTMSSIIQQATAGGQ